MSTYGQGQGETKENWLKEGYRTVGEFFLLISINIYEINNKLKL